jgi:hypothetical protein
MKRNFPPTWRRAPAPEFAQRPPTDHTFHAFLSEEKNALLRSSPPRSLWPKLDEFEQHLLRINEHRTALLARSQGLEDEIRRAEDADREAMAEVALEPAMPRPKATAPRLQEELEGVRRELDSLLLAEDRVLAAKSEFVKGNQKKMTKEAAGEADRHEARYAALVAELAQVREALVAARQTMIWAACYGTAAASESVSSASLMAGLAEPTRRVLGIQNQLAAEAVFAALREDGRVLRHVGTPAQQEALGKRIRKREADWQQGEPDLVGPHFGATWAGSAEEAAEAERAKRYAEAIRKRLWGN